MSSATQHLGLAVGLDAVDDGQQSLQGQKVGGVELARHREGVLEKGRLP